MSRQSLSKRRKADIRRMVRSFEDFAIPGPRRLVAAKPAIDALERALMRAATLREPVVMRIKEDVAKAFPAYAPASDPEARWYLAAWFDLEGRGVYVVRAAKIEIPGSEYDYALSARELMLAELVVHTSYAGFPVN